MRKSAQVEAAQAASDTCGKWEHGTLARRLGAKACVKAKAKAKKAAELGAQAAAAAHQVGLRRAGR